MQKHSEEKTQNQSAEYAQKRSEEKTLSQLAENAQGMIRMITDLRHKLHRNPELSLQETGTIQILEQFLRENTGLKIVDRNGWFYAVKPACGVLSDNAADDPDRPIAFRADMDALPIDETIDLPYGSRRPGVSHKCGHDGHCAALCGLALAIDRRRISRTVYLIFQPAEEIGQGGARCADFLREAGVSEVYAFHNLGGYPEGEVVFREGLTQPASEGLHMILTGMESHASEPERGVNPAVTAAEIVQYAEKLSGEPHRGMVLCTVTGVRVGNGDFGISAGEGEVSVTLRAEIESEMKEMEKNLTAFAEKRSRLAGLEFRAEISDYFPETRNDDECLERVVRAAERLNIPCQEMKDLWRASEDFGYYTKVCPGAIFYIGNGETYPPLHTAGYDFNDNILPAAVNMFLALLEE